MWHWHRWRCCEPVSRRLALALWGFVAYLFATWWLLTHRLDRFWLPLLPPLAVLAGLGADWVRNRGWSSRAGHDPGDRASHEPDLHLDGAGGLERMDRRSGVSCDATFRELESTAGHARHRACRERPRLLVGQAAVFHVNHHVIYNTVFNPETIEILASGKDQEFHDGLRQRNLTHIYVDWKEIQRHRQPGGYGFTDFVTPIEVRSIGCRRRARATATIGPEQELYAVSSQELYRITAPYVS